MKGIILYKSKYGATKKYAEWLSGETGFEARELAKVKVSELTDYDTIVLGGGIYASGVAGLDFLKKNFGALESKRLIVFCDGASPYEEKAFEEIRRHNLKGKLADIPLFYCRGALDMEAMSFADRNLCKLLRKAVARKDPSEYEGLEAALMAAGEARCDWTDRAYLEPVLAEIHKR